MAEQLKNTLSFNLAPGASVVLPHGLKIDGRALAPDVIFIPSADLEVPASDATSITLFNQGAVAIAGDVLVEAWHTIERAFGDVANIDLPVKPYIVVSVNGGNAPAWPPFQTGGAVKIYARKTGNDTTGDGTLAKPYRTFQRAVRDVPRQITPGMRVVVDCTGLGQFSDGPGNGESFPPNYALPAIQSPFGLDVSYAFPDSTFPFSTTTAFEIVAVPRLATSVAPADQIITGGDLAGPGITFDYETNLIEIHTTKTYGVNALEGLFLQGAFGVAGVIHHNTANVIYVTGSFAPDEPLTTFFGLPVAPLSITEPSTEFRTSHAPGNVDRIKGGFYIAGDGSLGMRGIKIAIDPLQFNPTGFNTEIFGSRTIFFENCSLDGIGCFHSGGEITFIASIVRDASFVSQLPINFLASMLLNIPGLAMWAVPTTFKAIGFAIKGCTALGARLDAFTPVGRGPMMDLHLRNGTIYNSVPDYNYAQIASPANFPAPFYPYTLSPNLATPGHGIIFRGGHSIIDHVKIFNCAADGIHIEAGFGIMELRSVTGGQGGTVFGLPDTANGGYGLRVTDGAFVRVSDQDPVQTGTGDSFTKVGTVMTLHDAAGLFRQTMVGDLITIAGSTSPANDGTFQVASVSPFPIPGNPGGTALTYVNAIGVVEAFPGTWAFSNPFVTDVAGAIADIYVGDPTPGGLTSTWAAFHIAKQLYDITAVGVGGATGSGSRVFEKP